METFITVYGLCDAPEVWYLRIKEVPEKFGMLKSKFDDVLFYWRCLILQSNGLYVKALIPNPGVPSSKPLGGSKANLAFYSSEVN